MGWMYYSLFTKDFLKNIKKCGRVHFFSSDTLVYNIRLTTAEIRKKADEAQPLENQLVHCGTRRSSSSSGSQSVSKTSYNLLNYKV